MKNSKKDHHIESFNGEKDKCEEEVGEKVENNALIIQLKKESYYCTLS